MRLRQRQGEERKEIPLPNKEGLLITELYEYYAPKLFAYVRRRIPALDDTEDMLLEVFLAALEHEQDLAVMSEDEQRAWLWTVARNKVIDYSRRVRRYPMVPLEQVAEVMEDERTPEQVVLQHEEYDDLHDYLKRLSTLQQEVLHLRFTGGLRCAEIATVLHKREGAIRTMLSRALEILRNIYEY
jgi:RNA polymerase sigma factor (sigma-70 family)